MSKTRGRVTLPSESGFLNKTRELMERWGADAIRDSDGTKLDRDVKSLDAEIYTTYFAARGHNEFAVKHDGGMPAALPYVPALYRGGEPSGDGLYGGVFWPAGGS
ncbi:MAG: 1,3-beta-galactosyl-N-acetylhexosamine phosphorylase N-terminal domain-containing protein [Enterocloster clostridioformis]